MNRRKLLGLVASGALVLGAMFASTGVVSADGSESWTGQGTTDGQLNDSECDASNTPFLLWVFTPGGGGNTITAVKLTLGGSGTGTFDFNLDNGQWKVQTDFFDLDTLTAVADYTGNPGNGNVNLVISHGCAGETTSSSSSSESSSSSVESSSSSVESSSSSVESSSSSVESSSSSVESSSSSVESSSSSVESSSSSESHSQTVSGESSSITEPNTATIGDGNSSNRGSSAWLLIAALGALFGSILVLTPSKAKNRE